MRILLVSLCIIFVTPVQAIIPKTNCPAPQRINPYAHLFHLVSVIGEDDRVKIQNFKPKKIKGFSRQERRQALACMGYVHCPGHTYSTGFSVDKPDRIVTARHTFYNHDTNTPRSDFKNCYFANYAGEKIPLRLSKAKVAEKDLMNDHYNDYIVLDLESPIKKCSKPFEFDSNHLEEGETVIMLTHVQRGMNREVFRGHEPIAQECQVRKRDFSPHDGTASYRTDCDANRGASGGPILTRDSRGSLKVRAIQIGSGSLIPHFDHYDEASGAWSVSIGMDGRVQRDILSGR